MWCCVCGAVCVVLCVKCVTLCCCVCWAVCVVLCVKCVTLWCCVCGAVCVVLCVKCVTLCCCVCGAVCVVLCVWCCVVLCVWCCVCVVLCVWCCVCGVACVVLCVWCCVCGALPPTWAEAHGGAGLPLDLHPQPPMLLLGFRAGSSPCSWLRTSTAAVARHKLSTARLRAGGPVRPLTPTTRDCRRGWGYK